MKRTQEEENFRRNIFLWRNHRGMSQLQVAMKAGIRTTGISQYERGLHVPSPESAQKVADALEVDLEILQRKGFNSDVPRITPTNVSTATNIGQLPPTFYGREDRPCH